ncbi:hypothetical protein Nepgr_010777 [Nepenthes gracilis]|uniref:S-type anion channel SLAH2 n=1 Tax=Nepenthes gracilis TaxID=150966 RepID=A0AAD3XLD2_NEPGR|nr:hypothetical protein Nepgr_010777 [Nepenthes gracilis]
MSDRAFICKQNHAIEARSFVAISQNRLASALKKGPESYQHSEPHKTRAVSHCLAHWLSMEIGDSRGFTNTEALPSLIEIVSMNQVAGFDTIEGNDSFSDHPQPKIYQFFCGEAETTAGRSWGDADQPKGCHRVHSVSISMLPSPLGHYLPSPETVILNDHGQNLYSREVENASSASEPAVNMHAKFYSQPIPKGITNVEDSKSMQFPHHQEVPLRNPRNNRMRDTRFDSFKTRSGKIERQLSRLRGKPVELVPESKSTQLENEALPVDRYFDALEGPELDTLRPSEEPVFPEDRKWPFLLRYPVSSFGICLGTSSQAILWKTLATSLSMKFLHLSLTINLVLWCISVAVVALVATIYSLKIIVYFEAVRREYYHPVRVNFFFAPWIALLFLALGVPSAVTDRLPTALWYALMAPIFCLELKIYGQWMSGGQRRLSKVANPSNHLAIVGNFVGALLGASMGLKEGPIFFFAVGLAHYTVLFVTLYQRLPTNETLPKELHPVFFLFVAAPSVASLAWAKIHGSFDYGSRIAYFIALFLYFSLAVRVNFFRGFRFSIAWWAYTFPMTGAAIATIRYANEVTNIFTRTLAIILSSVSSLTVLALLLTTIVHAFVLRDLFPNDIAIAISNTPLKPRRRWFHLRPDSSDAKQIENYLKFLSADPKKAESSVKSDGDDIESSSINGRG